MADDGKDKLQDMLSQIETASQAQREKSPPQDDRAERVAQRFWDIASNILAWDHTGDPHRRISVDIEKEFSDLERFETLLDASLGPHIDEDKERQVLEMKQRIADLRVGHAYREEHKLHSAREQLEDLRKACLLGEQGHQRAQELLATLEHQPDTKKGIEEITEELPLIQELIEKGFNPDLKFNKDHALDHEILTATHGMRTLASADEVITRLEHLQVNLKVIQPLTKLQGWDHLLPDYENLLQTQYSIVRDFIFHELQIMVFQTDAPPEIVTNGRDSYGRIPKPEDNEEEEIESRIAVLTKEIETLQKKRNALEKRVDFTGRHWTNSIQRLRGKPTLQDQKSEVGSKLYKKKQELAGYKSRLDFLPALREAYTILNRLPPEILYKEFTFDTIRGWAKKKEVKSPTDKFDHTSG